MKNLNKLLIIIGILFIPCIANAVSSFTCEAGDYTCEFDVQNSDIECKSKSTGKKLDLDEPLTDGTITYTFDHFEINGVNQGREPWNQVFLDKQVCPDFLYTMNKRNGNVIAGLMYFDADYYFKFDPDDQTKLTKYSAGQVAAYTTQEMAKDHYVFIGRFSKTGEIGSYTCDAEASDVYGKFQDLQISYEGKCKEDNSSDECKKLLDEWKAYIETAEEIKRKWDGNPSCESAVEKMRNVIASASIITNNTYTTTTTKSDDGKKEKTYDFSNDGCPLGEEVTKDLSGALKVMKILAPIFVFVYTVYDTIVALTKGDAQAEGKKMLQKFLKRIVAALTLFAIPVLIDVLFQLFNIWDSNGKCDFNSGNTKVEVNIKESTTKAWTLNDCLTNCKLIPDTNGRTSCENKCKTKSTCYANCENIKDEKGKANCRSKCNQ